MGHGRGLDAGTGCAEALVDVVGEGGHPWPHLGHIVGDEAGGAGEGHGARDVLRAGTVTTLLAAAQALGLEGAAHANRERAHADRAADLMGRNGDGVGAGRVERDAPEGLHGVHVSERASLVGGRYDLGRGLHDARLVVGGHDAHEGARVAHRAAHLLGRDHAVAPGPGKPHLEASTPKQARHVQHRVVLDGGEYDPVPPVPAPPARALGHAEHGEVVRLGAARGHDDLARAETAADGTGEVAPGPVEHAGGLAPERVERVGVGHAEGLTVIGEPGVTRLGAKRGGCGVVEVDVVSDTHPGYALLVRPWRPASRIWEMAAARSSAP